MARRRDLDRSVPEQLMSKQINTALEGLSKLATADYEGAAERFSEQYRLLLNAQKEYKRTIYKGAALYNVGLARTYSKQYDLAIWNFSLAYIEDLLSTRIGSEREADSGGAAKVVTELYGMDEGIIAKLKKFVLTLKKKVGEDLLKWSEIADPESIFLSVLKRLKIDRSRLLSKCRQKAPELVFLEIPQPWSRRVFIGGNYDVPSSLFAIAEIVRARGYLPKLACNVTMMPDLEKNIHDGSLMLLHTCRYAIFDVTSYSGWLMELERTRDYGIKKVLLVRNTMYPGTVNKNISRMIKGMGKTVKPYKKIGDLEPIIEEFLPEPLS